MKITPDEFKVFAQYIHKVCGITLGLDKAYLIDTRLGNLVKDNNCDNFSEFLYKAQSDRGKVLEKQIIDAITTQESLFFRDHSPYEMLKYKIIPDLIDRRSKTPNAFGKIPIRIWSAACSIGQEPYSMAMTVKELIGNDPAYSVRILGTDISDAALGRAQQGNYNKFEIERGLDTHRLHKYFTPGTDRWQINPDIRNMVTFQKMNLMEPFKLPCPMDIVFCRNVAIYFSPEDKARVFNKIADALAPDGFLVIGSAEFLTGICDRFESQRHIKSIFYQLKAGQACCAAV